MICKSLSYGVFSIMINFGNYHLYTGSIYIDYSYKLDDSNCNDILNFNESRCKDENFFGNKL